MKKVIFSFLFIISQLTLAQVPSWEWARNSTGNNYDDNYATATDQNGNVIVTGVFMSSTINFGSFSLTNQGFRDAFIVKYDLNGTVLWAKNIGGISEQQIFGICTDSNNNIYITGDFDSPTLTIDGITINNSTVASPVTQDIFIAKLNNNGEAIWVKSAGGARADYGNTVVADNQGNVYLGGSFFSLSITIGGLTLNNVETVDVDHDVFFAKFDSNGNVVWAKSAGGNKYETITSVDLDNLGNLFVSGYFYSPTITFNSTILTNTNNYGDIFILKYNPEGLLLWTKTCGGTNYESVRDIKADNLGNLYVTGYFQSQTMTLGTTTLTNASTTNKFNIFLAKYNANGALQWARRAGGTTNNDYASNVEIDSDSNPYIVGAMSSNSVTFGNLPTITSNGQFDIFVAKYDQNGNAIWSKNTGSSGNEKGNSSALINNSLYVTGQTNSSQINFNSTTISASSTGSVFTAKINLPNLDVNNFYQKKYSISPNPVKNSVTIKSNGTSNSIYSLTDMNGRELLSGKLSLESTDIDVSHLQKGIYILTYDHKESLKIIKE